MIPPAFDGTTRLTVRRTFPATRERVFRAWTQPEALLQWFRPEGKRVIISKLEVQVGGSFCFDVADGGDSLVGTYLEIIRPEKLVFTWSSAATDDQETVVTVEFIEHGLVTQVVLTHERLSSKEMLSLHQAGWLSLLDQLDISSLPHS
jgi:uncharacterized protein YndB with AHSA1/START domain